MALLLENATVDTEGSAVEFFNPCTVYVRGLEGGKLSIELSPSVNPPVWAPVVVGKVFDSGFVVSPVGAYKIRAVLSEVTSGTSCTVHAIEG